MTQPTFTQVRAALAAQVGTIPGLRTSANRFAQINPPAAVVMPAPGTFIRYGQTFDGQANISLRIILLVSEGDTAAGQDAMDPYVATSGPQSVFAALEADGTCGGVVEWAKLTEVTGYGLMNFNGIDYLAAHFIVDIGI